MVATEGTLDSYAAENPELMAEFRRRGGRGRRQGGGGNDRNRQRNFIQRGNDFRSQRNREQRPDGDRRARERGYAASDRLDYSRDRQYRGNRSDRWSRDIFTKGEPQRVAAKSSRAPGRSAGGRASRDDLNGSFKAARELNTNMGRSTKIIITNLARSVDQPTLTQVLSKCVGFQRCDLHINGAGRQVGVGSASFVSEAAARKAINFLNGNLLNGRKISATIVSNGDAPPQHTPARLASVSTRRLGAARANRSSLSAQIAAAARPSRVSFGAKRASRPAVGDSLRSRVQKAARRSLGARASKAGADAGGAKKPKFNWRAPVTSAQLDAQLAEYKK